MLETQGVIKQRRKRWKIKEELLNSLKESEDEDEPRLNEIASNTTDPNETIRIIKYYKKILKTKNIKVRNIVGKQRQLLK